MRNERNLISLTHFNNYKIISNDQKKKKNDIVIFHYDISFYEILNILVYGCKYWRNCRKIWRKNSLTLC